MKIVTMNVSHYPNYILSHKIKKNSRAQPKWNQDSLYKARGLNKSERNKKNEVIKRKISRDFQLASCQWRR